MEFELKKAIVKKLIGTVVKIPKCTYEKTELYRALERLEYKWKSGKKISENSDEYTEGCIKLGHWHYGQWVIYVSNTNEGNWIEVKDFLSMVTWLLD